MASLRPFPWIKVYLLILINHLDNYELVIIDKKEYYEDFQIKFTDVRSVIQGQCKEKSYLWPVKSLKKSKQVLFVIQCEHA